MFLPHFSSRKRRCPGILRIAPAALALLFCVGCASPGSPRPPSLYLASPVRDLRAERAGDSVLLNWTSPARTADGDPVRPGLEAVLCRREGTLSSSVPVCIEIGHLRVSPGPTQFTDPLPPSLRVGRVRLLEYRVEVRNAANRSAGPSSPAFTASGPVPPPTGPIRADSRSDGAAISWHPEPSSAAMQVQRTITATSAGPIVKAEASPRKSSPGASSLGLGKPRAASNEVTLVAETPGKANGGLLDTSVKDGDTYNYVAQRVATMVVDGHSIEVRGLPSPPVSLTYRDVFAPSAPSGLISLPGGGFDALPSIDLSWEASSGPGTLTYKVYRREGNQPIQLVTPQPIPAPAWRDSKANFGITYSYRVTAVDDHGNESSPSPEIHETLRK